MRTTGNPGRPGNGSPGMTTLATSYLFNKINKTQMNNEHMSQTERQLIAVFESVVETIIKVAQKKSSKSVITHLWYISSWTIWHSFTSYTSCSNCVLKNLMMLVTMTITIDMRWRTWYEWSKERNRISTMLVFHGPVQGWGLTSWEVDSWQPGVPDISAGRKELAADLVILTSTESSATQVAQKQTLQL